VIYADANVVIRLIEGDATTRAPLEARLLPLRGTGRFLLTSRLTRLECRVKPLRASDVAVLGLYDAFFSSAEVEVLDLTAAVVEKATELRAALNVKTPDALHLASAIVAGATAFLTGDKGLARCAEIAVEVL
jgi:predicted nucleic acid-binding protein